MGKDNIINTDETIEKVADMSDDKQTNYMLQRMINDYLDRLDLPSTEDILNNADLKEEPGVLTPTHIKLLQCMVKDYYKATGNSIELTAKQKGINLVEGQLSSLEEECIDKLLADYCKGIKEVLDEAAE